MGSMTSADESELTIDVDGAAVSAIAARPSRSDATVIVAHGAGAGMEHPFMSGFTRALNRRGIATLRFNFPYREAGRKFPDRPPVAIAAWRAAVATAHELAAAAGTPGEPIWATGKSFGGRMASMAVAEGLEVSGLVFLGYPLHPPGNSAKLRDEHLYGITVPMLFMQGTNDPFASPNSQLAEVVERIGPNAELDWVEGGGHSFEVKGAKRSQSEVGAGLTGRVSSYVRAYS